jgi:uncharacterized protein
VSKIVVFGAGGKAGRKAVAEAVSRGHQVTAVVRDPTKYSFDGDVVVVAGDVTDATSIANVAEGHDGAVQASYQQDLPVDVFFPDAARALLEGLSKAGATRLVLVGIGTQLEVSPGVKVHDTEGFPEAGKTFSMGHVAELDALQSATTDVDWVMLAPPPVMLDDQAERTGQYRTGGIEMIPAETFSYADLAVALIDEIDKPRHHRELVAIA